MTQPVPAKLVRLVNAKDLDDREIRRLWVPFGKSPDSLPFFDPSTTMATVILGGKGSGKTHLLRYFSFAVQSLRYPSDDEWTATIADAGYLGVYTIAGGISGSRFSGKGITQSTWVDAFAYYVDLWLAQCYLDVIERLTPRIPDLKHNEARLARECCEHFSRYPGPSPASFHDLRVGVALLQKRMDIAINDLAFHGTFDPEILCSRGSLIFGFPETVSGAVECLTDLTTCYYMDEYENFDSHQQRYFNTLLRERRPPVTFRIGARMYGMRTYSTQSAGEQIREGSEYDKLSLDSRFREDKPSYRAFSKQLLLRRIQDWSGPSAMEEVESCFGAAHDRSRQSPIRRRLPTPLESLLTSRSYATS